MEQRTIDWHTARLGWITGSRIIDIMPGRSGYKAARANYMAEKVTEILTGEPIQSFTSAAMEWGTETEPLARMAYEQYTGNDVEEVGFLAHPQIEKLGGSPDGLVEYDGMIEIKCPNTATHIDTLLNRKIKPDYIYQMQTYLAVTNRKWCDFVSYDPRLPEKQAIFVKRIERDENVIADILFEVDKFSAELEKMLERLNAL